MQMRFKILLSGLIIVIIIFSLYSIFIIQTPSSKFDDIKINNGENSIFTGYTTSEIAEKIANAFDLGPLRSKNLETHGGITSWYKYYYKNDASIYITVDISSKSLWPGIGSSIRMYGGKRSYDEITNNTSQSADFILSAWKQFLNGLNYQLNDDSYNFTYKPWRENGLDLKIRQICNNEIPLMNTGMDAYISQEDSQINNIEIDEWSRIKIERNISVSLTECKNIIQNGTPDISINKSKLNFTGFIYFDENVYYFHKYEIPIDEVDNISHIIHIGGSIIISENGTMIETEYEQWVGYNFYVNVETNELKFSKYGINYLKK